MSLSCQVCNQPICQPSCCANWVAMRSLVQCWSGWRNLSRSQPCPRRLRNWLPLHCSPPSAYWVSVIFTAHPTLSSLSPFRATTPSLLVSDRLPRCFMPVLCLPFYLLSIVLH